MIVRGAMGFVSAPLHPACARAVGDWTPLPQRSLVNGLITGAAILGVAAAHKVFGSLIDRVGWPEAFIVTGIITALWGSLWWLGSRGMAAEVDDRRPVAVERERGPGALKLLANRSILLLTLSYGAVGYVQYLFFYWMHYYFETKLLFTKQESDNYVSFPTLAMAIAMPIGGLLSDTLQRRWGLRWGRAFVPLFGLILAAGLVIGGLKAQEPLHVVAWFSFALAAVGASEGAYWATAVELGRRHGGAAAALINTGANAVGLLAPMATPLLAKLYGWDVGISAGAAFCVVGALCWLGIDARSGVGAEEPAVARR
jgi:MFS family permease